MRYSRILVAALLAVGGGCSDGDDSQQMSNRQAGQMDDETHSAFGSPPASAAGDGGAEAGVQGACELVCEGEQYACTATTQAGCGADAFENLPRCLHSFEWTELQTCDGINARETLASEYPRIDEGSDEPENKKVLCPFLRMLTRAGFFDKEAEKSPLIVGIHKITGAAREFGCSLFGCGTVASLVSAGQLGSAQQFPELEARLGAVNLEALHRAGPLVAHDCGLTFAKGGVEVDEDVRQSTLVSLQERADAEGRLSFKDLEAVKLQICESQEVSISRAGEVEIGLIFSFLGGNERGFIEYADVERFFYAELPQTVGDPGGVDKEHRGSD